MEIKSDKDILIEVRNQLRTRFLTTQVDIQTHEEYILTDKKLSKIDKQSTNNMLKMYKESLPGTEYMIALIDKKIAEC